MSVNNKTTGGKIANAIIFPMIGIVVLAVAYVFTLMIWTAHVSDDTARENESNLIRGAIRMELGQIAKQQEGSTVWDEAYFRSLPDSSDSAWLRRSICEWLSESYGHSRCFILSGNRTVLTESDSLNETDWVSDELLNALQGPISRVRALYINSFTKSLSGQYIFHPEISDGQRSISQTGLTRIGRRTYAFAITAIMPEIRTVGIPRNPPSVLVTFVQFDDTALKKISDIVALSGLALSSQEVSPHGRASITLEDPAGDVIDTLYWQSRTPGSEMLSTILPVLSLLAIAIGGLMGVVIIFTRQSTRKLAMSKARAVYASKHDSLSGLPNRDLFNQRLSEALAAWAPHKGMASVIYLDLDHFKDINDTLGHAAGDDVIRSLAARLQLALPPTALLGRISGDEFALLMTECPSREWVEQQLRNIHDQLNTPLKIAGTELYVSMSMGAVVAPNDGMEPGELLRKADIALYDAKESGRARWSFFASYMEDQVHTRENIARELRKAIDSDSLSVAYQPQLAADSNKVVGVEALARWTHPEKGAINPAIFVPIAEETGLINDLGLWVLRRACRDAHMWPDLTVAVNISPTQFKHPCFVEVILDTLTSYKVPPSRLEIEVTESIFAARDNSILDVMKQLKLLGVKIALDDFGSGYSSLSFLRRFPFDTLKIDRDFVSVDSQSKESRAILRTIVDLGKALGMTVLAEGVETAEQLLFLKEIGCESMQGYFIARPAPVQDCLRTIRNMDIEAKLITEQQRRALAG